MKMTFEPGPPDLAFHQPAAIAARIARLLRAQVTYAAAHAKFYRRRLDDGGLDPAAVSTPEALARLPLTTKADLENAEDDFLCVPRANLVDLCLTSGTTGTPVAMWQTAGDLERLAYNEATAFAAAGFTAADRVVVACAMGRCFMAGLAYFLGLKRLGALAIRTGTDSLTFLCETIRREDPTAIVGVPSMLLTVAARLRQAGFDPAGSNVSRLMCIGEPVRGQDLQLSALGQRLADAWQAEVFGTYASTEMATAFADCACGAGGHLLPDLVVVEVVDDDGRPLPAGEPGQVVVTPLQVAGMPLLRFATGDIAVVHDAPCACGRQTPRLGPVIGRRQQMLKYHGTTIYPPAVFSALQELADVDGYYLEAHRDFDLSDRIRVVCGVAAPGENTAHDIREHLAASIRVRPEVVIDTPEAVRAKTVRAERRKPIRFFDHRESES